MNERSANEETIKKLILENRFTDALELCDRLLEGDVADPMRLLILKGEILWHTGEVHPAIAVFEEALRAVPESNAITRAEILNNLGVVYREIGRYDEAERSLKESLDILDKNGQEPLEQTVHSLNNLGILKRFTGEYVEAERLYLKALQLQKAYSGTDTMPYTNLLNNLGLLYFSLGIDATAKQYYEEAIDIRRRLVGEKSVPFMQSLNNLAAYHQRAGEWGIAEMEYLRVLSFLETRGMFNHPAYNKTLKNYAALLLRMSRHSEAITYLDRALSGLSQKVGVDNVAYAKFVAEKGYALYQMKRYPESEKAAMSAFRTMAVTSGIRNFETLSVLSQLSAVLVKTGKPEAAYRTALNVVRWQNELLFDMVYALPEEEMMAFLRSIRTDSDRLMSLLVNCFPKDRRKIENVYAVVLLRKGIILEVSALRAFFLDKRESAEKPWMREWKEAKTALSKLLYYNNPAVTLAEKMEMVKKIQSRIQEIERKEARQFASAMPLENSKRINIPSLYEKIGDHSTVLDFYYLESENRYILFVLEDRSISTRSIDDAKTLHEKIREFRHAIGYCQQTRGTPDIHMVKRTIRFQEECARNLYRRLFSSAELKRNRDYHLSPDYEMATLPFDALQTPEGEYLLEFCDIHCLTTPKELFREAFNRANKLTASIVVDPDFGEMPVSGVKRPEDPDQRVPEIYDIFRNAGLAERGFTRLKGTKYEGQKARELLEQAGWTIDAYLSGNAAKKHTIAGHRFPKLLHIATHGFFLDQSQEGVNPLLRSGLVFAGANAGGDSILTAYEVTALDLSQTETVILSACNTGLGESFIGEGLLGFQRAFLSRGVKEIVMTLWNISDRRSVELMGAFYTQYVRNGSVSQSLRHAKRAMLENNYRERGYADPYTWAGFVCIE